MAARIWLIKAIEDVSSYCLGIAFALAFTLFIQCSVKLIKEDKGPYAFFHHESRLTPLLGYLEAIFSFSCFIIHKPELIGGWLVFKTAAKWEIWQNIIKVPEKMEGIDSIVYLKARNRFGTNTLNRWLVGTLGNILAGFLGAMLFLWLKRQCC